MRRPSGSIAREKGVRLDYGKLNSVGLLPTVDTFLEIQWWKKVALCSEFQNKTKNHSLVSETIFKPLHILKEFYLGGVS